MSQIAAEQSYARTFKQKTAASKGYTPIEMKLGAGDKAAVKAELKQDPSQSKYATSKLPAPVQDFVKLIFDKDLMEKSVAQVGYDVKKLPLGQLSEQTVKDGYAYLREIEAILGKIKRGETTLASQRSRLAELSGKFYTHIPHDFGRAKMANFVIDTIEALKEKMGLVSSLIDIKAALDLSGSSKKVYKDDKSGRTMKKIEEENPLDVDYTSLKCIMDPIAAKEDEYKMIDTYIQNTSDGRRLQVLDMFKIEREGEDAVFNPDKLGNRKLLFHGSRFSNYVGILSNGMRIAPPEAPKTGYNFGKGVYFADFAGKSAPYCCPYLSNNVGIFVLCEVALGKPRELLHPDYDADQLPTGHHSTHALGLSRPDPTGSRTIEGGIEVPMGKKQHFAGGYMGHNEFIVYSTRQIKMRYIVKVKMA